MMLSLPEFGIYGDPPAATSSLGVLRIGEYDRPVLRFGPDGGVWTRTPALSADDLKAELEVEATISPDGQGAGTNVVRATGPQAAELRAALRWIEHNRAIAGAHRRLHT